MAEERPDPPFSATSGRRLRGACDIRESPAWGFTQRLQTTKGRQHLRGNTSTTPASSSTSRHVAVGSRCVMCDCQVAAIGFTKSCKSGCQRVNLHSRASIERDGAAAAFDGDTTVADNCSCVQVGPDWLPVHRPSFRGASCSCWRARSCRRTLKTHTAGSQLVCKPHANADLSVDALFCDR